MLSGAPWVLPPDRVVLENPSGIRILILYTRASRHREVTWLAQRCTVEVWVEVSASAFKSYDPPSTPSHQEWQLKAHEDPQGWGETRGRFCTHRSWAWGGDTATGSSQSWAQRARRRRCRKPGRATSFLLSAGWPSSQPGSGGTQGTVPMRVSQREVREGPPPCLLQCLRFTQTLWKSTAWGKFHTCKTKVLPSMTCSTALPCVDLCTSVPLHSLFLLQGRLSFPHVLNKLSKTISSKKAATLLTQVPSKALGTSLHYGANSTLSVQQLFNYY